jgi:hypothetical protein
VKWNGIHLSQGLFNSVLGTAITILQSMIDKLIEVGRGYGMEINVEKT